MTDYLLVLTTFPDIDTAQQLAQRIVHKKKLAACVNILPQVQSIYKWQSQDCMDTEHVALIKTTKNRYPELESYLHSQHPYELPEIIAVPITAGLEGYLNWITENTRT